MIPSTRTSGSLFFDEFECRGCGSEEAYRSRPRGFFERFALPVLLLQPVRCDHCYLRSYVPLWISARERLRPERKKPQSQPAPAVNSDSRVA